jgi:uncharacterized phiE125 gp8 family phage protein
MLSQARHPWSYRATFPTVLKRLKPALTLDEAKQHLRIGHDEFDTEIAALIEAATELTEQYSCRLVSLSRLRWVGPFWPARLLAPPFRGVVSVQYWDSNGIRQTLQSSGVVVVANAEMPAELYPAGDWWPDIAAAPDAVQIDWLAGYDQPKATYRAAIKLLVSQWYESREASASGGASEMPLAFRSLAMSWGYLPQQWEHSCQMRDPVAVTIDREAEVINVDGDDLETPEGIVLVADID